MVDYSAETAENASNPARQFKEPEPVEPPPPEEPSLSVNVLAGSNISYDTRAVCEAIYALAGEVRALRKVVSLEVANNLDNISEGINGLIHEIPTYEGRLQVDVEQG